VNGKEVHVPPAYFKFQPAVFLRPSMQGSTNDCAELQFPIDPHERGRSPLHAQNGCAFDFTFFQGLQGLVRLFQVEEFDFGFERNLGS
jgi:hypothetical protein